MYTKADLPTRNDRSAVLVTACNLTACLHMVQALPGFSETSDWKTPQHRVDVLTVLSSHLGVPFKARPAAALPVCCFDSLLLPVPFNVLRTVRKEMP